MRARTPELALGGAVAFLVLTAIIASIDLTAQSFSVLILATVFGYLLAIFGMAIVLVGRLT
ncbi:MAG: hypothetical protein ABEI39_03975 [Halobacteriales archaeon]